MPNLSFTLNAIPAAAPILLVVLILGGIAWTRYGSW